jgi:hypothetical protein
MEVAGSERNVGQFHNHFMRVTYGPSKISCTSSHATMQSFENALAYYAIFASCARKNVYEIGNSLPNAVKIPT